MLKTNSHIYSLSVDLSEDPTIKVTDLCFDFHHFRHCYYEMTTCDGYLLMCTIDKGGVVWNPLLRHTKWISPGGFTFGKSMGYDGSGPEKSYKIINIESCIGHRVRLFEFATNAWKVTHSTFFGEEFITLDRSSMLSLNGNIYWMAYRYPETREYFIKMLDFSKEMLKIFCIPPCKRKRSFYDTPVLSIYKGDRFSVLHQCIFPTRDIKIWVTEKKIGNGDDGDHVVWINFMTVSIPDFPMICNDMRTSYFVDYNIYGKSFVLCYHDDSKEPREAWVYIVRGDMCKKIKIDEVVSVFQSSVYIPSLITIS